MKTLLATTALALMAGGPLLAQQVQPEGVQTEQMQQQPTDPAAGVGPDGLPLPLDGPEVTADQPVLDGAIITQGELFLPGSAVGTLHASELIGMAVYSSAADYGVYGVDPVASTDRTQWDTIGSVNDILITPDGQAQGVLVDIGGFLGIGARTVALDMSQVHFLRDETGDHFVAVNSTREALEAAPEYLRQDEVAAVPMVDPVATGPGAEVADPADPMAMTRPTFTREGYQEVDYTQLTADELQSAAVYDANDDNIGSIGELILTSDGMIDQVIVDVGGFLGIGVHSVALDFDELQILRAGDGTDIRVYIDQTRENLEQRPAYAG